MPRLRDVLSDRSGLSKDVVSRCCDRGRRLRCEYAHDGLLSRQRHQERATFGQPSIDEELLPRAAEINDSIASEFDERAVSPMDSAVLARMAELGVETDAAVTVAI